MFSKSSLKLVWEQNAYQITSQISTPNLCTMQDVVEEREYIICFIFDINREKVSPIQMSLHSIPEGNNPYFKKFQKIYQWDANKTF